MLRVTGDSGQRTARDRIRDIIAIHRLEYPFPIIYLCYAGCGACYAVTDVRRLLDASVLAVGIANLLLVAAGLLLNTTVDIRTDQRHRERSYLATAVLRFGRRRARRWVAAEMTAALVLAVLASVWLDRWLLTGIAAGIIALQLLYNVEPVRLKRRGFAGPVAFCISVVVLPCLLSHWAVRPEIDMSVWLIFMGLGISAIGRMTWWAVPDLAVDTATGMTTPAVRYGATRALALSCLVMLAGLVLLGWGLWGRYGPSWILPGLAAHGIFLGGMLPRLGRTSNESLPSSVRMRKHSMSLAMAGEVTLVVIPLLAG